ncbi:hypothetical protein GLOIN_2v1761399 [Rhizophagus irregularis DAOM 181602=DAOM 197198]|nr:hypothetical protein GLOIN_2v1761399 [Rhizophagus irregularis DAOM 181602=DAOM 197198]
MLDESTRGQHKIFVLCVILWNSKNNKPDFQVLEMKDLATCTGISVAQAIYDIFDHFKVNSEQYFVCISDNTNYMSGKSGGAIKVAFESCQISRWLYELICAEQYLERRDIHIQFTEWLLSRLKA